MKNLRKQLIEAEPSLEFLFSMITGDCDSRDMGQRIVDSVIKVLEQNKKVVIISEVDDEDEENEGFPKISKTFLVDKKETIDLKKLEKEWKKRKRNYLSDGID
jgi:hypothetical protein